MINEKEIAYYRSNITDKYVIEVQTILDAQEKINKKKYATYLRVEKLKSNWNYKRCKVCGKLKRLSEFYKNHLKKQGVFDYCKECAKEKAKQKRKSKKGK